MELEETQAGSELDDCIPTPVDFWQKTGLRALVTVALFGPAVAVFVSQYLSTRHQMVQAKAEMQPSTGYSMKSPDVAPHSTPAPTAPITAGVIANPPRSVSDQAASLQLTTMATGVTFAIYSGMIADKVPPPSSPLRSGTSPGTVENLHSGNYTIFFHKEGWPDGRTEIELHGGQVLPVAYAFPHGEVTITSDPSGAEIFLGTASLGLAPLKVDLPAGEQELTARLKHYPDRKQSVTVSDNSTPTIDFQMRIHRHTAKARPTPTPSLIDRVGGSLKHLFSGNSTPLRKTR